MKGLAIVLRAANLHKLAKKEEQNLSSSESSDSPFKGLARTLQQAIKTKLKLVKKD